MRLLVLGSLGLALLALILLTGPAEGAAVDDDIRYCGQSIRDEVVVYVGRTSGMLTVEFNNDWPSYFIQVTGECFTGNTTWTVDGPVETGKSWGVDLSIAIDTPPGRYNVTITAPTRGNPKGETLVLPLNFTLVYTEPFVFRSFEVHRTTGGTMALHVEVVSFVKVQALVLGLDVGEGYDLDPGTIRAYSLRPGVHLLTSRVEADGLRGPPTSVSYRGYSLIDGMVYDVPSGEVELQVFFEEDDADTQLLILAGSLALMVTVICHRVLRSGSEEEDQAAQGAR